MTRSSQNERGGHSCSNLTNQLLSSMERAVEWEPKELKVYPPIYRFGPAGRWLRERLQAGILHGVPVLQRIQYLQSPALNTIMAMMSFLGEEEFYTPLVAFIVWLIDAKLGRLLCVLMALGFYITGVLKNLLCLPRPPIQPLQRCNDWSLPSHHAVLSVNVPWYIWFYIFVNYDLSVLELMVLFSIISLWSFCVMFSRMYLGVHSPADILTGGVLGCLLLSLWLLVDSAVDEYIASSQSSILLLLPLILVMLCVHPDPAPTTIIFTETVCMMGVATGFVLGRAHAPPSILYAAVERRYAYTSISSLLLCCVVRFVLGFTALLASKEVVEYITKTVLVYAGQLVGIPTTCVKRRSKVTSEHVHFSHLFIVLEEPPSLKDDSQQWTKDHPFNVDVPTKFISYVTMGTVAMEVVPYLFHIVGI